MKLTVYGANKCSERQYNIIVVILMSYAECRSNGVLACMKTDVEFNTYLLRVADELTS